MTSKKGSSIILTFIIGLVVGLMVVAFLAKFNPLLFSLFPGGEDSKESFQEITAKIISLRSGEAAQYNLRIAKGDVLIGFSKAQTENVESNKFTSTVIGPIERPETLCPIDLTCICLCDSKVKAPGTCKTLHTQCSKLEGIERIEGIIVDDEGKEVRKSQDELFIKGKANILLSLQLGKDNILSVKVPENTS